MEQANWFAIASLLCRTGAKKALADQLEQVEEAEAREPAADLTEDDPTTELDNIATH